MSEKNFLDKINIVEVFSSIQGEGLYVGEKQLFIRFPNCNLKCAYCDTNHSEKNSKNYLLNELLDICQNDLSETISLTGGEPLLCANFLTVFLPKIKKRIYLETNGTLPEKLKEIIDFVDIVAMDIKLESSTKQKNNFETNEEFIKIASKKEVFIKIVFDENITSNEIENVINIAKKYGTTIVLQPKMPMNSNFDFEDIFEKFYSKYKNIRLIPQTHKFLNVR